MKRWWSSNMESNVRWAQGPLVASGVCNWSRVIRHKMHGCFPIGTCTSLSELHHTCRKCILCSYHLHQKAHIYEKETRSHHWETVWICNPLCITIKRMHAFLTSISLNIGWRLPLDTCPTPHGDWTLCHWPQSTRIRTQVLLTELGVWVLTIWKFILK